MGFPSSILPCPFLVGFCCCFWDKVSHYVILLSWNSLYRPWWSWTHSISSASAPGVLGLKSCTTMPGKLRILTWACSWLVYWAFILVLSSLVIVTTDCKSQRKAAKCFIPLNSLLGVVGFPCKFLHRTPWLMILRKLSCFESNLSGNENSVLYACCISLSFSLPASLHTTPKLDKMQKMISCLNIKKLNLD